MRTEYPRAFGSGEYLLHKKGKPLSRMQAMKAKCYECMGYYIDGRVSCNMPDCPMFLYSPYKKRKNEV